MVIVDTGKFPAICECLQVVCSLRSLDMQQRRLAMFWTVILKLDRNDEI